MCFFVCMRRPFVSSEETSPLLVRGRRRPRRNGRSMDHGAHNSEHEVVQRGGGGGRGIWCGCSRWGSRGQGGGEQVSGAGKKYKRAQQWKSGGWGSRGLMRMGSDEGAPRVGDKIGHGDLEGIMNGDVLPRPEHLVILVNGIVGSANDWKFAAERLRSRLGRHVAIHCSENNSSIKTFDGVDVMGRRLAVEVREVIDKTPGVTRISFLAHSLGGLVSRYAIAELYSPPTHNKSFSNGVTDPQVNSKMLTEAAQSEFTIGGLQPENFITIATPHLGCRGTEQDISVGVNLPEGELKSIYKLQLGSQLPFLLGIQALEKTASCFAHWFVGRTGKHLFLTDGSDTELPLLRKMVTDCKEGQFISSLGAFKRRTVYANVNNDQMVGWRTSSLRRKSELPEINYEPLDLKYPHIVREEDPVPPSGKDLNVVDYKPPLGDLGKQTEDEYQEQMVAGLTRIPWHRVDVSFRGARGSYQAHNLIQVKNPKIHSEGADVIEHVIDKQFAVEQ